MSLVQANHSSRGVVPSVMRRCVWSRNLVNEEALAHWGLSCQKKNSEIIRILQELNARYVTRKQHQFQMYRNNLEDLACLSSQHVGLG